MLLFIKIPIYHGHISIIRHKAVQFLFMAHQTFYTAHILQNLTKYHKTEENRKYYFWIPVGGSGLSRISALHWSFWCSLHQHTVHEKLTSLRNISSANCVHIEIRKISHSLEHSNSPFPARLRIKTRLPSMVELPSVTYPN